MSSLSRYTADRIEYSIKGEVGNARVGKVLFLQKKARCKNPFNKINQDNLFFDFLDTRIAPVITKEAPKIVILEKRS